MHDASACLRFTIKFYRKADRACGKFLFKAQTFEPCFSGWQILNVRAHAHARVGHVPRRLLWRFNHLDKKDRGSELCLEAWQTSTIPSSAHFRISESSYLWNLSQKSPKEAAVCSLRQINTTSTVSRDLFHPSNSNKASPGICFRSQSSRDKSVWLGCGSDSPLDFRDRRGGRIW
jgi:hypothetical protein